MRLGDATWQEIEAAGTTDADALAPIVLIPVGATEQHGPHLPIATDTLIAEEIAQRAIHHTDGLLLAPTMAITASGEHAGFAGTLSVGTRVLEEALVELGRSADWAAGIVLVNAHGGNHHPVSRAVARLHTEQRRALAWWPAWPRRDDGGPADLHAGRIETSLMLAIDPGLVRWELATRGPDTEIDDLRALGVRAVSASGVLGDPTGASGREGEALITEFVTDLVHHIEAWRPFADE